jgi:aminodeoxyfutalosine deaminase
MERLVADGIALEICPTSNVRTRSVPSLEEHPLPALVEAGVTVTINSDDPPMFGTTLNREYEIAAELLGLDEAGVTALATAAVDASFAPDDLKARLRSEIEAAGS